MNKKMANFVSDAYGVSDGIPIGDVEPEPFDFPNPLPYAPDATGSRIFSKVIFDKQANAYARAYRFKVKPYPGSDEYIEISGVLSAATPINENSTVQLLLAGGANNSTYWNWPLEPEIHSYVRHATQHGFVTLNLDRPGYGNSDLVDPTKMDFANQGFVVDQVVKYLKSGVFGVAFRHVILNGHSMGGMVAWHAASISDSADAVVVSGVGHNLSDMAMSFVKAAVQPIEEHPRYGLGNPRLPGYFVRRINPQLPNTAADLYTLLLEDTVMLAELEAIANDSRDVSIVRKITAPVLFILGQWDLRWCTTTKDCATDPVFLTEPGFYSDPEKFTSVIVPDAGHLINKDPGAPVFFKTVTEWLIGNGLS